MRNSKITVSIGNSSSNVVFNSTKTSSVLDQHEGVTVTIPNVVESTIFNMTASADVIIDPNTSNTQLIWDDGFAWDDGYLWDDMV